MSKIYVSTYRKYTTGSTKGEWLDLSHYASKDDFLAACAELHSDESDPELMFQDWEEMPAQFVRAFAPSFFPVIDAFCTKA